MEVVQVDALYPQAGERLLDSGPDVLWVSIDCTAGLGGHPTLGSEENVATLAGAFEPSRWLEVNSCNTYDRLVSNIPFP